MKRIIMHWSAGGHRASDVDRQHYHFIVQGDGSIVEGSYKPEDNLVVGNGKGYAAHTRNANTASIGVAVAAMKGAVERPFNPGPSPITDAQVAALTKLCARLCKQYGISVTRHTVLSHAEVQRTLGIAQRGKWDIMWIPGMDVPGDPVAVGDKLRGMVSKELERLVMPIQPVTAPATFFAKLVAAIMRLFGGKK